PSWVPASRYPDIVSWMNDAVRLLQLFAHVLAWSRVERCGWSWLGIGRVGECRAAMADGPVGLALLRARWEWAIWRLPMTLALAISSFEAAATYRSRKHTSRRGDCYRKQRQFVVGALVPGDAAISSA